MRVRFGAPGHERLSRWNGAYESSVWTNFDYAPLGPARTTRRGVSTWLASEVNWHHAADPPLVRGTGRVVVDALTPALHAVVREIAAAVCRDFESELLEYGGEDDHVHVLVSYPPKVAISRLVNSLKGVTARKLRKEHAEQVRAKLCGNAFWSPSYCAVSTDGAALDTVRAYIERQRQGRHRGA